MLNSIIQIDPEILSGAPVFRDTRVPIKNFFDYLETGETLEAFLEDFPSVKKEHAIKLLEISQKLLVKTTETLYETAA